MNKPKPIPKPFCFNKSKIKAIVLGADPTNESFKGNEEDFVYVFGIGSGDGRYFEPILKNLAAVGLTLIDIYVQNLIPGYQDEETSKNRYWEEEAKKWVNPLAAELNRLDPKRRIPVLATAERIVNLLVDEKIPSASMIYTCDKSIHIPMFSKSLDRKIIPFYRHPRYRLEANAAYREKLLQIFG